MKKKGELTTQQLVTIIILIVSFSVILFFIFRLNLGGEATNKEICHNSVLMKSKSSNLINSGILDCRTSYICISGGEKCDNFASGQEVVKINLKKKSGESDGDYNKRIKNETMKAVADEMADCWWMFGEGKVNYVGWSVGGKATGKKSCALCSRLKFGDELKKFEIIEGDFFKQFLLQKEKIKGISYFSYLYNTNDLNKVKVDSIDLKSEYVILTGVADEGVAGTLGSLFGLFGETNYGPFQVMIKEKTDLDKFKCDEFLTKA